MPPLRNCMANRYFLNLILIPTPNLAKRNQMDGLRIRPASGLPPSIELLEGGREARWRCRGCGSVRTPPQSTRSSTRSPWRGRCRRRRDRDGRSLRQLLKARRRSPWSRAARRTAFGLARWSSTENGSRATLAPGGEWVTAPSGIQGCLHAGRWPCSNWRSLSMRWCCQETIPFFVGFQLKQELSFGKDQVHQIHISTHQIVYILLLFSWSIDDQDHQQFFVKAGNRFVQIQ